MTDSKMHYVDNARFQELLAERWCQIQDMNPDFDFTFSTLEFLPTDHIIVPDGDDHDLTEDELEAVKKQLKTVLQHNEKLKHQAMADIARPPISEEIGLMLYKIAENLSYRYNFINYSYRDEMVGDGAETCIRYIDKYDTVKFTNPFGYFTQTCFYAFVRRIKRETGQSNVKAAVHEAQSIQHDIHDKYEFQNCVVDSYYREGVE